LSDGVGVVFVKYQPETKICIKARTPLLRCRDLGRKADQLRLFRRDRKQKQEIAIWPFKPDPNGNGPPLATFCFTVTGFADPQVRVANNAGGLNFVEAQDWPPSLSSA